MLPTILDQEVLWLRSKQMLNVQMFKTPFTLYNLLIIEPFPVYDGIGHTSLLYMYITIDNNAKRCS